MKYLICKQDAYDTINYITDDMSMPDDMEYKDFLNYVHPYVIENWEQFIKELNSFKVLHIEYPEGTWVIKEDKRTYTDFSKEELHKLNDNNKKELATFEKVRDEKVEKGKRFLQRFSRRKR